MDQKKPDEEQSKEEEQQPNLEEQQVQQNQEQEIQQQGEEQFDFQQIPQLLDPFSFLAHQIQSIDNQVLLQRGPLESLTTLLQVSVPTIFDDVNDAQTCVVVIQAQYHKKKSDLETTVYHIMKGYDEMNQKVNLNQLEKIMRILKSKQKSIYISKDVACCCHCSHHQNEELENPEQTQEQTELISEEQHHEEEFHTQVHQHIHESQCEDLIIKYQEQNQQKQDEKEEQQQQWKQQKQEDNSIQQQIVIEQTDQIIQCNLESPEQQDTKIDQIQQDESKVQQIEEMNCVDGEDENQQIQENYQIEIIEDLQNKKEQLDQLRQMQQQMQQEGETFQNDLEQNVEELKESIQQSRLQIEKLTEQRNQLLLKSKELAEKQLELRIQQAQLIEQLDQQKEKEEKQEDEKKNISCSDIFGIMSLHNLNLNQLQNYDTQTNSLVFTLHNNYKVEIKGDEADLPRILNKDSPLNMIPQFIVHSHILPYLGAFELFKVREVCGWFKEQVKSCWPSVFKREMFEQLLAKDLKKNIFNLDKMHFLKKTLYNRIKQLIEAMMQVLEWDILQEQINSKTVEIIPLKIVIAILTLMKKQNRIQYLYQVDEDESYAEEANNLKETIMECIGSEFGPLSMAELKQVDATMISNSDFSLEHQGNNENKTGLYLCILMNLLYFFSILKLNLTCEQYQIMKMKTEADILGSRQIYNQNFLEGAYKKLLLRNYVEDLDEGEIDGSNEIEEAQKFLKNLTNLVPTENPDPDIVIKKNKTITKIYIDVNTKLDILVSSIQQYKDQKPVLDETQKVCYELINEIIEVIVQREQNNIPKQIEEQQIQE